MLALSILGCGNVGKTLAALWRKYSVFEIGPIYNRDPSHTAEALTFIGAGSLCSRIGELTDADFIMVATPDKAIVEAVHILSSEGRLKPGTVVFHCSGALGSDLLQPLQRSGVLIGSAHPLMTFSNPETLISAKVSFGCAVEGEKEAVVKLRDVFEQIGCNVFEIDPGKKALYHTATVMVCNYLTALIESGLKVYECAGIPRDAALKAISPITKVTLENVLQLGPAAALSGPIARGDYETVAAHVNSLKALGDEGLVDVYKILGKVAAELAERMGKDVAAVRRIVGS